MVLYLMKATLLCLIYQGHFFHSPSTVVNFYAMHIQAKAYFEALPASKTPIRGTPGERYRQKQLIRQVPAHDIDMLYCNNLTLEEKKQMEIFLRLRKEKSLGKGMIKMKESRVSHWVSAHRMSTSMVCASGIENVR